MENVHFRRNCCDLLVEMSGRENRKFFGVPGSYHIEVDFRDFQVQ